MLELLIGLNQRNKNNSGFGIFGGGNAFTSRIDKYHYTNDSYSASTNLTVEAYGITAIGDTSVGIFAGGYAAGGPVNFTNKYVFKTAVVTAGTELGVKRIRTAGFGNSTIGYFCGGGNTETTYTDKYTFFTDTIAPGSLLTKTRPSSTGMSNTTKALISGEKTGAKDTNKYTYASDVFVPGISMAIGKFYAAAATNEVVGIIGGGFYSSAVKTTELYSYAPETTVVGSTLTQARERLNATGNKELAVFAAGHSANFTDRYQYSTNGVASGSVLSLSDKVNERGAVSTVPGGF